MTRGISNACKFEAQKKQLRLQFHNFLPFVMINGLRHGDVVKKINYVFSSIHYEIPRVVVIFFAPFNVRFECVYFYQF